MTITLIENFRAVFYAPFYAAEALGAYRAEGIEVMMKSSGLSDRTLASLKEGAGDVVWGGPLRVMTLLDRDPTSGFVAFCEVVGRDPFFLVGRTPNPGFRPADLAGRTLAVVTEVPTPWICLQQDLRLAGVDPAAVRLAPERTMEQNTAALRAGELELIQVFQPYAETLVESGAGHIWYAAASRGATAYTTFNTTRRFIAERPDQVLAMTRAMYRTQKWIAAHGGRELARLLASYFPGTPQQTLAACCERYQTLGLWNTDPRVHREGLEWLRDAMLAAGAIHTRFAFEQCVDQRFAEQAVTQNPTTM